MMRAATVLAALCLTGGPALAAGADRHCMAIDKAKAMIATAEKKAEKAGAPGAFSVASPGAYHFLQGFYVANPATPAGLPPGDGALLYRHGEDGMILWTRGKLACAPLMVPGAMGELMKLIAGLKTGAVDADGSEL